MSDLELREKVATLVMGRRNIYRCANVETMVQDSRCLSFVLERDDIGGDTLAELSNGEFVELPAYESDIAAAWLVVERMRELGWDFGLDYERYRKPQYHAAFNLADNLDTWRGEHAPTAPLAICLAAKAAIEATQ